MTEEKKRKKLKNLIRFHNVNKIDNYNYRGGKKRTPLPPPKKKKKKNPKNLQKKSNHKNNKCFSWVRDLSLKRNRSPPHLPWMLSNTALISGPAVGTAQVLIWSYSCVFLPLMSTAIRTSVFSFVGALNVLLCIPYTQSLPSRSCGFNLQLV